MHKAKGRYQQNSVREPRGGRKHNIKQRASVCAWGVAGCAYRCVLGGPRGGRGAGETHPHIHEEDALGQDMFLIGPSGPLRRWLALCFAEAMGREVEVVSLTQDAALSALPELAHICSAHALAVMQLHVVPTRRRSRARTPWGPALQHD